MGRWIRYWFSPGRILFLNTPAWKLPHALALTPHDHILDIGCGCGSLLMYLHKRIGFRVTMEGIDVSPMMVDLAEREVRRTGLAGKIRIRQGRATELPYIPEMFNVVLSTYVVKHLSDEALCAMLEEVHRVLNPGGYFCCWEAGNSRIKALDWINLKLLSAEVSTINLRSSEDLCRMLHKAGFQDIERFAHAPYLYYPFLPRVGFICRKIR
jgi:ubiquinone/menaquinone biosynthesis C-methylase UbiE